jgi:YesN/AraC family two-component response regulator
MAGCNFQLIPFKVFDNVLHLGAFEYINKPVKIDELKSILKKIFKETSH